LDITYKGVKIPKKRADGRYFVTEKTFDPVTGKEGKISIYGRTEKEFAYKVLTARAEYNRNKEQFENQYTSYQLGQWMEHQLQRKLHQKKPIKPNTYRSYEGAVNNHIIPFFGADRPVTTIKKADIEALYKYMVVDNGLTSVVKDVKAMLLYAFDDALDNDIVDKNPVIRAQIPTIDKQTRRALTPEEEKRFITALAAGERQAIAYYIALWAGLRLGEVLSLQWVNIDLSNRTISVEDQLKRDRVKITDKKTKLIIDDTKSDNAIRLVPINDQLYIELQNHYQRQISELGREPRPDDFVIINQVAKPQEPSKISRRMESLCGKAKITPAICFHELRHTCATKLAEKGATTPQIAALLGQEVVTNLNKRTATLDYMHIDTLTLRDLL
jgi:integrase